MTERGTALLEVQHEVLRYSYVAIEITINSLPDHFEIAIQAMIKSSVRSLAMEVDEQIRRLILRIDQM